jgi:hypothetical protein
MTTTEQTIPTDTSIADIADLALAHAMYEQLHSEINQRLDLRQGITTFTLLVAASLFGLGLQNWASSVTVLCYPILALFLSLIWGQHDVKIGQIAAYLRQLEDDLLGAYPGWERWRRLHFQVKHYHIELPARGVFLASETLAMVIGLARFVGQDSTPATTVLFIFLMMVDIVALVLTGLAIKHHRAH